MSVPGSDARDPTLLARVLAAYASARRYSDVGRVLLRHDGAWQVARRFTTSFVRQEHLKLRVQLLECGAHDDDNGAVVVEALDLQRSRVATMRVLTARVRRLELTDALAACSGVTSAVSWLIPSLLVELAPGVTWFKELFPQFSLNTIATDEGTQLLVINSFETVAEEPATVAVIERDSGLLRSLEQAMRDPSDPACRQRIEYSDIRVA